MFFFDLRGLNFRHRPASMNSVYDVCSAHCPLPIQALLYLPSALHYLAPFSPTSDGDSRPNPVQHLAVLERKTTAGRLSS